MSTTMPTLTRRNIPTLISGVAAAATVARVAPPTSTQLKVHVSKLQGHVVKLQAQIAKLTAALDVSEAEVETLRASVAEYEALAAALNSRIEELEAAALPKTPTDRALIGLNTGGAAIPTFVTALPAARIYFANGGIPARWTDRDTIRSATALGCKKFVISAKDADVAKTDAFLATVPDGVVVYWTYFHEHDNNIRDGSLSATAYRASCAAISPVVRKHGHFFGPIHNGLNKVNGSWQYSPEVWAQNSPDRSLMDFVGFDGYAPKSQDPAPLYAPAVAYAEALGLPIVWGELGAPKGSGQAAWAAKARVWAEENTAIACWWHERVDESKPDYVMTDDTMKAWLGI